MTVTMTVGSAEPATKEQQLLTRIDKRLKDNTDDARANLGAGAIALAGYTVLSLLCPPAGIPGFITSVVGFFAFLKGWDLVENLGKKKSLQKAKTEVIGDDTAAKTKSRQASLKKWCKLSGIATGVLLVAALALPFVAPALLIPAAIAQVVGTVSSYGALAAAASWVYSGGAKKAATGVVNFADTLAAPQGTATAPGSADKGPSGTALSKAPSPAAGFDKAANGNQPASPAVVQADQPQVKTPKL